MTTAERILAALASPAPPQTMKELSATVGGPMNTCYQQIARLLKRGIITPDQLPWRKFYKPGDPRPRGRPPLGSQSGTLESRLESWMHEDGKDRVAAARLYAELQGTSAGAYAPVVPNDRTGILDALARILVAAGRDVANDAFALAFPLEAPLAQTETPSDLAGLAASRSSLD